MDVRGTRMKLILNRC